jgi:type I restriction enzyme M protein
LPLIFVKRLCDVFDDEVDKIAKNVGSRKEALKRIDSDHSRVRFYLSIRAKDLETQSTWSVIRSLSNNIGEELTGIIRDIAANNSFLDGVIDTVDYNATTRGQREVDDDRLSNLIEAISQKRLGLKDVDPDIIGQSYEYLIRKFAEGSGQTAGEFYTPREVGMIMAYVMNPEPGMEVYDPTCGSAGLLIKCELALKKKMEEANKKTFAPLRLYGQEYTTTSWAMAKMNMIIHDMEGEIELGDTFNNPKFKDKSGHGIKKFDRSVANPMWNQGSKGDKLYKSAEVLLNDQYNRFVGGFPGFNADWAWLQHIYSSLKDDGRAAVVLDTGAASRGSGNANTNKEKEARKWFIENDVIEGVLYLPENLFYNTTAPGIIIFLNKKKPAKLKNKIFLINAGKEFIKGDPKNYINDKQIKRIADIYNAKKETDGFSKFVGKDKLVKNDYNISPTRYIHNGSAEVYKPVEEILAELTEAEAKVKTVDKNLHKVLKELGF